VIFANAATEDGFRAANISSDKMLVITTDTDEINLKIARLAKEVFGLREIISVVNSTSNLALFKELGVKAVSPAFSTVTVLANLVTHPAAFSLVAEGEENLLVEEVILTNRVFSGKRLKDIRLPGDTLIISVSKNGEKIIPHGNSEAEAGDLIMLVGSRDSVIKTMRLLNN